MSSLLSAGREWACYGCSAKYTEGQENKIQWWHISTHTDYSNRVDLLFGSIWTWAVFAGMFAWSGCCQDVVRMLSGCCQDVVRMLSGCYQDMRYKLKIYWFTALLLLRLSWSVQNSGWALATLDELIIECMQGMSLLWDEGHVLYRSITYNSVLVTCKHSERHSFLSY